MFLIPLTRLGVDIGVLQKAAGFSRGPKQGHKYKRREFAGFDKKGRRRWRYYYEDEKSRTDARTSGTEEGGEEHEHSLLSDIAKFFPNLAEKLLSPTKVNEASLTAALDGGNEVLAERVKFEVKAKFHTKHHAPFVKAEKAGDELERTPLTRVQKAFELIPETMRKRLEDSPLKHFIIARYEEGYEDKVGKAAAFAHRPTGRLVLLAGGDEGHGDGGTFRAPGGAARYGSALTWTEEVVWHEMGHHVHYAIEKTDPGLWEDWERLSRVNQEKITDYAHTNTKEDFAETIACFLSHPKQLAAACPDRYDWMQKHVLTDKPTREELWSQSEEELTWWKGRSISKVGKIASQMRAVEKLSYVDTYQSEKDQFYSLMYKGRLVYMRVGPKDKDEEREWVSIAPTVDAETGLPVYDREVAGRFRAKENIKEIYDENGQAISDQNAWLWLRQDDEKVVGGVESKDLETYRLSEGKKKTHSLAYQLYIALGESVGSQVEERERVKDAREGKDPAKKLLAAEKKLAKLEALPLPGTEEEIESHNAKLEAARESVEALKRAIADGSDPASLDRHGFAPHEMTRAEFLTATPTFKFGALKKAETQPWALFTFDQKTKKRIPRVAYNPVTGKDEPMLGATVYEMENPDGTSTKITVQESDPFRPGDKILVPVDVQKQTADGIVTITEWQQKQIGASQDADPHKLAREYNTTVEQLLTKNARFAKGQITDPVLAALLNPNGYPIRNEGDLIGLMRESAKRNSSTWITVTGGSPEAPSNAHIKLRFDGGGNPVVEGEYWARRFGLKDGARLDQIINKSNTVKLDRIIEVKPKKVKIDIGAVVKYRDPKTGREVFGAISEINKVEGKLEYRMKPLRGQGTGLMTKNVVVDSVKEITDDLVPKSPNVRRRRVRPLKSDMLLYLDNVRYERLDEKGRPAGRIVSGRIKIHPPMDGSITADEIERLPGVRSTAGFDPSTGEPTKELYIDRRDLSVLREAFGGFVMDQHVTDILAQLSQAERARAESDRKTEVVAKTQIVNESGQVNVETDGLMSGLRAVTPDGKEFKLGSHQVECLQSLAKRKGRLMAAHFMGTGKTVTTIAGIKMMKNLKDPNDPSKPAEGSPRKRVAVVVPLNTITQWESAASYFTTGSSTVLGASTLAGAVQAFKWPERKAGESESNYRQRVAVARAAAVADPKSGIWNPDPAHDPNDIVIIPMEYWRDNEHDLREFGNFDGLVIDEAHKVLGESEIGNAVDRWNPGMNMLLMLTGTPVTNKLDALPRIVDILSNGQAPLGTAEDFAERYLAPSAVMLANGAKRPPRTDINPQLAGELGSIMQQYIHVATTEDVKGKTMPAVLLDENQPAHMLGMQEKMYRAAMASLTDEDREKLEQSAALGLDEQQLLSEKARRKINIARAFANSPGYKAPDAMEYVTYIEKTAKQSKKGTVEVKEETVTFSFPDHATVLLKKPQGWGGAWPSLADVNRGRISEGYYAVLSQHLTTILGADYDGQFAGKKISKEHLAQIAVGKINGQDWGKIKNPEYGPEGAITRGHIDPADKSGTLNDLTVEVDGERITVPIGTRFIRDPNKKAAGLYYHESDWNFSGSVGTAEGGEEEGEGEGESEGGKKKGMQAPLAGREKFTIQRHPGRRRERAMFDASMTVGNAKADELERYMQEKMNTATGGNPDAQFILFGNRIGSSCRTMESKMRLMGYMDVNEALASDPDTSSSDDKARRPKMGYFVTYFGKGATLGDRDINSEIFRKVKDGFGRDTETSMFVHRTLTGSVGKPAKPGEFKEGWSAAERKRIGTLFEGPSGESSVEIPMRVTTADDGSMLYVYESDIRAFKPAKGTKGASGRDLLQQIKDLEKQRNSAKPEDKAKFEAQMNAIFARFTTDRKPLSQHQMDVFNNCKVMVASDAAQVGLNWGNATELVMYDSLHSPMLEWQRITRAARMLDDIVPAKAKKSFDKIDSYIRGLEQSTGLREYSSYESSLKIVSEAMETLPQAERASLEAQGFNTEVALEAYFSLRTFEKINTLRQSVRDKLRTVGRELENVQRYNEATGETEVFPRRVKPQEITNADVMNEIIEKHLSPFEREILKSRKYLVNVKRLTTSVDMPEFKVVKDPETGKKMRVATGTTLTEVPARAEQAQLTQGRAKQVPYEAFLKMVQDAHDVKSNYDFIANVSGSSLSAFSNLPKPEQKKILDAMPAEKAQALVEAAGIKKSLPRFYVNR